jgi:hypothetical protein
MREREGRTDARGGSGPSSRRARPRSSPATRSAQLVQRARARASAKGEAARGSVVRGDAERSWSERPGESRGTRQNCAETTGQANGADSARKTLRTPSHSPATPHRLGACPSRPSRPPQHPPLTPDPSAFQLDWRYPRRARCRRSMPLPMSSAADAVGPSEALRAAVVARLTIFVGDLEGWGRGDGRPWTSSPDTPRNRAEAKPRPIKRDQSFPLQFCAILVPGNHTVGVKPPHLVRPADPPCKLDSPPRLRVASCWAGG